MSRDMDDLVDKLLKCSAWSTDEILRMLGYESHRPKLSPPPTPSLDLLRRFAKVAGWEIGYEELKTSGYLSIKEKPGYLPLLYDEYLASKWLDSPEALDAAAIVAVRKAGGLAVLDGYASSKTAIVIPIGCSPCERFDEMRGLVQVDLAVSRPRAAVLACLAAFEEKTK